MSGLCEPVTLPFVREGYRFQPDVCAAGASSVLAWSFRERNSRIPTFGFEGKVTELADVRSDVRVGADVFLQHAGFLTADATFLTDVLPSAATANIDVVLVGFVPATTDTDATTVPSLCVCSESQYSAVIRCLSKGVRKQV